MLPKGKKMLILTQLLPESSHIYVHVPSLENKLSHHRLQVPLRNKPKPEPQISHFLREEIRGKL